jgi:hypothetical protein
MVAASAKVITEEVEISNPRVRATIAGFALSLVLIIFTRTPYFIFRFIAVPALPQEFRG